MTTYKKSLECSRTMNIAIKADNAVELDQFIPVSGNWSIDGKTDNDTIQDVQQSIVNWMNADYVIEVKIYHVNGKSIVGDLPNEGTFVALRK